MRGMSLLNLEMTPLASIAAIAEKWIEVSDYFFGASINAMTRTTLPSTPSISSSLKMSPAIDGFKSG
jgi:hypothetical protein